MAETTPRARPGIGVRLAFGGAVFAALGIVPFKVATEDAAPEDLVVVVMLAAAVLNSTITAGTLTLHRRRGGPPRPLTRVSIGVAIGMGVLAAGANYTAGQGVAELDASVSTLLIQTQVLMATALGWAWLGERVTPRFLAGALLALVGVAAIPEGGGSGASVSGVLWALAAAGCFGAMQVLTRRHIERSTWPGSTGSACGSPSCSSRWSPDRRRAPWI
ncbi:MAG: DMT family transporter [Actinomycetota bacterium]